MTEILLKVALNTTTLTLTLHVMTWQNPHPIRHLKTRWVVVWALETFTGTHNVWFYCSLNFKLFSFPIFRLSAYLMKVVPETGLEHYIWYLRFYPNSKEWDQWSKRRSLPNLPILSGQHGTRIYRDTQYLYMSASYLDLHLEIDRGAVKNETIRQKRGFQFSHCELSIFYVATFQQHLHMKYISLS